MNLLVVTPLEEESQFFLSSCIQRGIQIENSVIGRLEVASLPSLGITVACGGHGKVQFAVQTQHLLHSSPNWDVVICAGAAGALVHGLSIGDVVVATTTVEHDFNNKFTPRPKPRFDGTLTAIEQLKHIAPTCDAFRVHFGIVASGDEDVIEAERRSSLYELTQGLVVAWEGAGAARACKFNNVPFVEIRGVTDTADHNASSDFETNLAIAMNNIATLIIAWAGEMSAYPHRASLQPPQLD
jgi:adenosylhomocysteine nucleosidase